MNQKVVEKLQELITFYGQSLITDRGKLKGLLNDYCNNDKKEIKLLLDGFDAEVPQKLLDSAKANTLNLVMPQLVHKLEHDFCLKADAALWIADAWNFALGQTASIKVVPIRNNVKVQVVDSLKKCPFCAEDIKTEAIKCRFCGELLDNNTVVKATTTANMPVTKAQIDKQIEMVFVQGGTFQMGSNDGNDNEQPVHSVTLSDFYIGKYQVTQKEWRAIMGNNPSEVNGDDLPVTNVSWDDCQEFIERLNTKTGLKYRLPTEAEWEYAARGGFRTARYRFSGGDHLDAVAWHFSNSGGKPQTVGMKRSNELGIHDMSGNVWEWCSDWYGSYSSESQTNPMGALSGTERILRGGAYYNDRSYCNVTYRAYSSPIVRIEIDGFRLVRSY